MSTVSSGLNYGYVGGTVNLTCSASAIPSANFSWAKDGEVIKPKNLELSSSLHNDEWPYNVESIGRVGRNGHRFGDRADGPTEEEEEADEGDDRYKVFEGNNTSYLQVFRVKVLLGYMPN